jgi:hypothetical protein
LAFEEPRSETLNIIGQSGLRLTATVNASGYDFSLYAPQGEAELIKRLIGCTVVSLLPPEGLDEALDRLSSYWEYYAPRVGLPAPSERVRDFKGVVLHGDPGQDHYRAG